MSEKTAVRTREKCGLNYFSLNMKKMKWVEYF